MPYIPNYDYDLFISYAHVDNKTAIEDTPGWVDQFQTCLEVSLEKRVGRVGKVKIWRDKKLTVFFTCVPWTGAASGKFR